MFHYIVYVLLRPMQTMDLAKLSHFEIVYDGKITQINWHKN